MFQVEWDQEDLNQLNVSLDGLHPPELVGNELKPLVANITFETMRYPPVPEGSTYERTDKLFGAWKYKQMNPLAAKIENMMPYAGYVQGREQTAKHAGTGWKVLYTVAEAKTKWLLDKIANKAENIWKS